MTVVCYDGNNFNTMQITVSNILSILCKIRSKIILITAVMKTEVLNINFNDLLGQKSLRLM